MLEWFESLSAESGEIVKLRLSNAVVGRIGYRNFVDIAQLFYMRMLTPAVEKDFTILKFLKLDSNISFHNVATSDEKYGVQSEFFNINKTEQISFLHYYIQALKFANIEDKNRILNLGINKGDEFEVIKNMVGVDGFLQKEFVGIDYSESIIEYAEKKLPCVKFICHDISALGELDLGRFDLVISIGTLQSSNLNFNKTFMDIYQNHLQKGGSIILGFPNCRWIDGEMIYGAKVPNYNFSELGMVVKDIHFCKKYLQQKGYRVVITGRDYLFLSARKLS